MNNKKVVICPYCKFNFLIDPKNNQIVFCLADEGGCDRRFLVDVKIKVELKTKKIEGE